MFLPMPASVELAGIFVGSKLFASALVALHAMAMACRALRAHGTGALTTGRSPITSMVQAAPA